MPRYLTKSRFKTALECPTKLFYTGKTAEYTNTSSEDTFLQALAEGGFQVGELAKIMYPGGIEVTVDGHEAQELETTRLLAQENVTIFEAAIRFEDLFIRVDVIRKRGNRVELIEVKAKSFDSTDERGFRGARGGIDGGMLSYLQDVAFQTYVFKKAFPNLEVDSFLLMADKSKACSVDGLNQFFKIKKVNGRSSIEVSAKANASLVGDPILTAININEYVREILELPIEASGVTGYFPEVVKRWSDAYAKDQKIVSPVGAHCGKCEFKNTASEQDLKSGLYECWLDRKGLTPKDFEDGMVLDIWGFRGKERLIQDDILKFGDVEKSDLGWKSEDEDFSHGLTTRQRQWMQVSQSTPGGKSFYLNKDLLEEARSQWQYPLHFIDFETARVAIPFFKGQKPYSNIAFQFSHHEMQRDGTVEHKTQFLSTTPGVKPNYEFVRELKKAVGDVGTVFMWSPHENTTLNAILDELNEDPSPPVDTDELRAFILSLTKKKEGGKTLHEGSRAMFDLCDLSKRVFFHPLTKGSNSIKKVLPAILSSSEFIREKYSQPIYGSDQRIKSLNFANQIWWKEIDGKVQDPYKLLPPVFSDASEDELAELEMDDEFEINLGGAASTAYARLQFEELSGGERFYIANALLRYCELDTLAMVMILEGWFAVLKKRIV
ncbi:MULTISPECIES: DUF2779 domain-containing protein [unclassified Polynucleobacter]|jgi:hypothetical protein|uniref:DUF2779 domain-containing protein n=1 Tax=unclassified Polynucleobacter TaxID=2640945 RepID=UPI000BD5DD76|nr:MULTISPECIES: DUF2779 domain-containing protein [unclassified Polynucleobacter]OYY21355.1 MAG: hypothetical protein B7Y67_02060 [Polynucleobacter sp. 35-46-11]OZA78044.1 MAG: hypothetical protein B7X71_02515 [Polynucleobacter sp. 39-46-10]